MHWCSVRWFGPYMTHACNGALTNVIITGIKYSREGRITEMLTQRLYRSHPRFLAIGLFPGPVRIITKPTNHEGKFFLYSSHEVPVHIYATLPRHSSK